MAEIKPKLSLRPSIVVGEKSPPPTGLLITHGKPNFTISRTRKHQSNFDVVDSAKPSIEAKSVLLKKTNRNIVEKKPDDVNGRSEFLQAHRKISEKIAKENSDHIRIAKTEVNNNFTFSKSNSYSQPHFAKIENVPLHTTVIANSDNSGLVHETKVNGHSKPALPEKPASLQHYKPVSPTGLGPNTKIFTSKSSETLQIIAENNSGVNFEQKTIVSFSKDLSSGPNKYPDTVKILKPVENGSNSREKGIIDEFSKLKFEIVSNGEAVVPVVINP